MHSRRTNAARILRCRSQRLQALAGRQLVRIGLSATQKPIERDRNVPGRRATASCTIVDTGHVRRRDLAIELPPRRSKR